MLPPAYTKYRRFDIMFTLQCTYCPAVATEIVGLPSGLSRVGGERSRRCQRSVHSSSVIPSLPRDLVNRRGVAFAAASTAAPSDTWNQRRRNPSLRRQSRMPRRRIPPAISRVRTDRCGYQ